MPPLFDIFSDEHCHLIYRLVYYVLEIGVGYLLDMQKLVENLAHFLRRLHYFNLIFGNENTGISFFPAYFGKTPYLILRYGTLVEYVIANKAVGAVHGYIAVNQILFLKIFQVVYDDIGSPCGYENLVATLVGFSYRLDC